MSLTFSSLSSSFPPPSWVPTATPSPTHISVPAASGEDDDVSVGKRRLQGRVHHVHVDSKVVTASWLALVALEGGDGRGREEGGRRGWVEGLGRWMGELARHAGEGRCTELGNKLSPRCVLSEHCSPTMIYL